MNEWIKNHWKSILIILLIVLVIGLFLYYSFLPKIARIGYNQAVFAIFQTASQCQQVPITSGNQTINLIAIECLQQQNS